MGFRDEFITPKKSDFDAVHRFKAGLIGIFWMFLGLLIFYWMAVPSKAERFAKAMDDDCFKSASTLVGYENREAYDFKVSSVYQHNPTSHTVVGTFMSFTPSIGLYHRYYFVCDIEQDYHRRQTLTDYEVLATKRLFEKHINKRHLESSKTL